MTWINVNAWREILSRVFDGFAVQYEVTPEWLVNPGTNRRLKLDLLYPEIGVAIRFMGLQGTGRHQRPSLEEEEQQSNAGDCRLSKLDHRASLVVNAAPSILKTGRRTNLEV